jgi:hypothetical protein
MALGLEQKMSPNCQLHLLSKPNWLKLFGMYCPTFHRNWS